jgi:cytochrome P450
MAKKPTVLFDHHTVEFVRDPYSHYRYLRDKCPIAHSDSHGGFWLLSRYDDVRRALLDPDTYSSAHPDRVAIPNTTRVNPTPMKPNGDARGFLQLHVTFN